MTMILKKFLLVAFLLPLMVVLSYAADAPEVDYIAPVNNYYAGMSVNFISGDHTQDSGGGWTPNYVDQPLWSDEDASHGLNFGKYFGSAAEYRHAIEVGYISAFRTEDLVASNNSHVYNEYKNVFTLDYLHLRTLTDNMEYFGSSTRSVGDSLLFPQNEVAPCECKPFRSCPWVRVLDTESMNGVKRL